MATYKDGETTVQTGDRARGLVGTHPSPVEGIVIGIVPDADGPRCQLSFPVPYWSGVAGAPVSSILASGWAKTAELERVELSPWG